MLRWKSGLFLSFFFLLFGFSFLSFLFSFLAKPQLDKAKHTSEGVCLHCGWSVRHCKKEHEIVLHVSDSKHSKAIWLWLNDSNVSSQPFLSWSTNAQFRLRQEITLGFFCCSCCFFPIFTTFHKITCVKTATIKNEALYKILYIYIYIYEQLWALRLNSSSHGQSEGGLQGEKLIGEGTDARQTRHLPLPFHLPLPASNNGLFHSGNFAAATPRPSRPPPFHAA